MKKKTFLLTSIILTLSLISCATSQENKEISLNTSLINGTSSYNEEDYIKANEFFSNALLIENNNEIALKNKILTLNKLDQNLEALALVKEALSIYPNSIKFKLIKARLLRLQKSEKEAIELYKEILETANLDQSYHKEYIQYLTSLLPTDNALVTSSLSKESNYLLSNNICTEEALIALCTMNKTSLLYSLMLKDKNSKEWAKIYKLDDTNDLEKSNQ